MPGTSRLLLVALLLGGGSATAEELVVVRVSPVPRSLAAAVEAPIAVEFDRPVLRSSVSRTSVWAFGHWSGPAAGSFSFDRGGRRVILTPDRRFSAGESVTVFVSHDVRGVDGSAVRAAGYSFQFWTRSRGSGFDFREIDRLSTRSDPAISSRAYGGFGSDLDGDGFLDLTIVNEDTDDLRTFLNRADRSGKFRRFLWPPATTGRVPSPSEPADFDRDGNVDVVVANTQDDSVSIFLGNGDGTFQPGTTVRVGGEPRGVAVLDADGDGDVDIAATSFVEGAIAVLLNDGGGGFERAATFGSGGGERAIAAGDMNGDGILDLAVGLLVAQEIHLYAGNGDGTFTRTAVRDSGGETWMLVLGDVDGDLAEDVVAVNSRSDNGAILAGDGRGGLAAARVVSTDPFPLAADLADLDGDGDLDWAVSSFSGDWWVYANDGDGGFARRFAVAAPAAASCSIAMDVDNDGALDLALIDELEDQVVLLLNRAEVFASGFESGDTADWSRSRGAVAVVSPGLRGTAAALQVSLDGSSRRSYVQSSHPAREPNLVVHFDLDVRRVDLGGREVEILRLGPGQGHARLTLGRLGGRYRVRLLASDGGAEREIGSTRVRASGSVRLRVEWASASGSSFVDGRAALSKNGRLRALAGDLANHGQQVDRVLVGLPGGGRGTGIGSLLIDGYRSTR